MSCFLPKATGLSQLPIDPPIVLNGIASPVTDWLPLFVKHLLLRTEIFATNASIGQIMFDKVS